VSFTTSKSGLQAGDTRAALKGRLTDGTLFDAGEDVIVVRRGRAADIPGGEIGPFLSFSADLTTVRA
jgi:hypothetical protein